jgi:hypothetical protein
MKQQLVIRVFVVLLMMLAPCGLLGAEQFTPNSVRAVLEKSPAPDKVIKQFNKDGNLDTILNNISKGDKSWIELTPLIQKGTDAGSSEDLIISLAYALPRNPSAVLSILAQEDPNTNMPIQIYPVCSAPFIEPEPHTLTNYLLETIAAIEREKGKVDEKTRVRCLAELKKVQALQ